ncbi:MAG: DUF2520 domain-containing protein [Thermoleophilia bacterium]|nr:DUF2520 domain-containing protein [Thermoleophilia bacterium]
MLPARRVGRGRHLVGGPPTDRRRSRRRQDPPRPTNGPGEPRLVSAGRTGTGRQFIDNSSTSLRFVVIGAGRLGASLALALRGRGARLLGYTAQSDAGRARAAGWLGGQAAATLAELVSTQPDLYVAAVPDQALPHVAEDLAVAMAGARSMETVDHHFGGVFPPYVAHTSGATSVEVLRPCEEAGAATFVFHPLQTFSDPTTGTNRFAGAAVAITPADPSPESSVLAFGSALARALDARPFFLPDEKRGLYHAAASLACNYLVTLEHHAEHLFVEAGLPKDEALSFFLPLVRTTLENIASQGTIRALTGPLSRGDVVTIASHLEALAADARHLLPLYRALGLATLDLVRAREEVPPQAMAELERLLMDPQPSSADTTRPATPGA